MNSELLAEAIMHKRSTQSIMILLPDDCCKEDAARLEAKAQIDYPLHQLLTIAPISAKMHPLKRVCGTDESYRLCGERASC